MSLTPFVASCLMLTATSDFHTDSVVYGPHLLGVARFFLGTAELLRSAEPAGGTRRSVGAGLLLAWSFFTVEYTYVVVPLLPALVWLHAPPPRNRGFWRALAPLWMSFIPA